MHRPVICALALAWPGSLAIAQPHAPDPGDVLAPLARDYESDPMARAPITFAVRVGPETWTVATARTEEGGVCADVTFGEPAELILMMAGDGA